MSRPFHPALPGLCRDLAQGRIPRREFLSRATGLGLSAALARGLAPGPAQAQAPSIRPGGTLRIAQSVKPLGDPRLYDWSEMGNQTRGFLEYLVQYDADGTFNGMLLERWEVNADATAYLLHLRPGVLWNNGDPFTARDVAHNIARWCDTHVAGNSMATRLTALIDPDSGVLRDDAVVIGDAHTLTLHLSRPDITLIASMSDYPAAIVHPGYDGGDPFEHGIGTGPFRPLECRPGAFCALERHPDHVWWGHDVLGGPHVDRVEFLDYGTDPASWVHAARSGEVDLLYETVGPFVDTMDDIGWTRSETPSAATMVIRANALAEIDGKRPYADPAVRRALALAVDNGICLELGYAGHGDVAANHHVCPIHPAYADIGPCAHDPAQAIRMLEQAGLGDFEHELITIDDEWQRNTGDAVAAQLLDAGIPVSRTILPGEQFWQDWKTYPLSGTKWNHRPLGIQVLSLAYRSGSPWNETGFADARFDALLDQALAIVDHDSRRDIMRALQTILREEGVIIQPFWRRLYTHHNVNVTGVKIHPSHEIHLHKIGFAAE